MSEPIGQLRHRIEIQRLKGDPGESGDGSGLIKDGSGGLIREPNTSTSDWETIHHTWAKVSPLSGREAFFRGRLQPETAFQVIIRSRAKGHEIKSADRILFEGKILQIKHVGDKDERRRFTKIICEEGPAS